MVTTCTEGCARVNESLEGIRCHLSLGSGRRPGKGGWHSHGTLSSISQVHWPKALNQTSALVTLAPQATPTVPVVQEALPTPGLSASPKEVTTLKGEL